MDKKLTLSLNAAVIDRAKSYAKKQKTSLSKLVENYLAALTGSVVVENADETDVSPLVKSLIGIVSLPDDYDFRSDYADYLIEKYK